MNETTILLSPSPGDPNVKPDFLATVEPLIPRRTPFALPFELVLDGYTREPWSSGKAAATVVDPKNDAGGDGRQPQRQNSNNNNGDEWESCYLVSTDGRNRLPGFLQYLRGRKKAAVAKFEAPDRTADNRESSSSSAPSGGGRAMLVVPYDPPPVPPGDLPEGVDESRVMFVRYLRDENIIVSPRTAHRRQLELQRQQKMQQQKSMEEKKRRMMERRNVMEQNKKHNASSSQSPRKTPAAGSAAARRPPSKKNGGGGGMGGLLGNLLGAQRRTENHLHVVRSNKTTAADLANFDPTAGAAGCINAFRAKVSADLEAFKSDPNAHSTKISIDLSSLVKQVPTGERDRVTMDVFKFAVHEQVEEVGMDRWVAAKEPSEFMDECTIAVYKEGHCPPEILEDLNKGELPDEIKGQAKHLMEAQSKAMQRKAKRGDEEMVKRSLRQENHDASRSLNANKRDRRTLEQIQRDMQQGDEDDAKRGRYD